MNPLPVNTQLHIDPSAFMPKVDGHALRKRLMSPQAAPRKSVEPEEQPVTRVYITAPTERVWRVQQDSHVAAYFEWKGNEPLGWLKMRCRELDVALEDILGKGRTRPLVAARHQLIAEVKARYQYLSLPDLGRLFVIDHTSALFDLRKMAKSDPRAVCSVEDCNQHADTIWRMASEGASFAQIAKTTSLTSYVVGKFIKQGGGRPKKPKRPTYDDLKATVVRRLSEGATTHEIAVELGVYPKGLHEHAVRNRWLPPKTARADEYADRIKRLFMRGHTRKRIAKILGVSTDMVSRVIKREGWKR